tara:strand:- start:835 stop:1653 length:819 start_codon:yes stop_codon:yes gene_type:complete
MDEQDQQFRKLKNTIETMSRRIKDYEFNKERRENQFKVLKVEMLGIEEERDNLKIEKDAEEKARKKYKDKYFKLKENPKSLDEDIEKIKSLEKTIKARDEIITELRDGKKIEKDKFLDLLVKGIKGEMELYKNKYERQEKELDEITDERDECKAREEVLKGKYDDIKDKYKKLKKTIKNEAKEKEKALEEAFEIPLDDILEDDEFDFSVPEEKPRKKKSPTQELYERVDEDLQKEQKQTRKKFKEKFLEAKESSRNLEQGKKPPKGKLDPYT